MKMVERAYLFGSPLVSKEAFCVPGLHFDMTDHEEFLNRFYC